MSLHAWLRFDAIETLLPGEARTMLEIGTGVGSAGARLARRFTYVGLEPDTESFESAARRIGTYGTVLNQCHERYRSPFGFDLVCAFEVLEHMEDDRAALRAWLRHVRPGGWLLVSVPSGATRFGAADVRAGHYRRYDPVDITNRLAGSGLVEVEVVSIGFPVGYALEAARNLIARRALPDGSFKQRTDASGRWLQPPDWAAPLTQLVSAPLRYAQRPFGGTRLGTGLVARGRKPE